MDNLEILRRVTWDKDRNIDLVVNTWTELIEICNWPVKDGCSIPLQYRDKIYNLDKDTFIEAVFSPPRHGKVDIHITKAIDPEYLSEILIAPRYDNLDTSYKSQLDYAPCYFYYKDGELASWDFPFINENDCLCKSPGDLVDEFGPKDKDNSEDKDNPEHITWDTPPKPVYTIIVTDNIAGDTHEILKAYEEYKANTHDKDNDVKTIPVIVPASGMYYSPNVLDQVKSIFNKASSVTMPTLCEKLTENFRVTLVDPRFRWNEVSKHLYYGAFVNLLMFFYGKERTTYGFSFDDTTESYVIKPVSDCPRIGFGKDEFYKFLDLCIRNRVMTLKEGDYLNELAKRGFIEYIQDGAPAPCLKDTVYKTEYSEIKKAISAWMESGEWNMDLRGGYEKTTQSIWVKDVLDRLPASSKTTYNMLTIDWFYPISLFRFSDKIQMFDFKDLSVNSSFIGKFNKYVAKDSDNPMDNHPVVFENGCLRANTCLKNNVSHDYRDIPDKYSDKNAKAVWASSFGLPDNIFQWFGMDI